MLSIGLAPVQRRLSRSFKLHAVMKLGPYVKGLAGCSRSSPLSGRRLVRPRRRPGTSFLHISIAMLQANQWCRSQKGHRAARWEKLNVRVRKGRVLKMNIGASAYYSRDLPGARSISSGPVYKREPADP
jgi:hypothetical protein